MDFQRIERKAAGGGRQGAVRTNPRSQRREDIERLNVRLPLERFDRVLQQQVEGTQNGEKREGCFVVPTSRARAKRVRCIGIRATQATGNGAAEQPKVDGCEVAGVPPPQLARSLCTVPASASAAW